MLARVAASERVDDLVGELLDVVEAVAVAQRPQPLRADLAADAIWACRSPAMWSGWRTLERMNFQTSALRSPAIISRQIGIHSPSSNTSRAPAPMP